MLASRKQEYLFLRAIAESKDAFQFSDVVNAMQRIAADIDQIDQRYVYQPKALTKLYKEQEEAGRISYSMNHGYALTDVGLASYRFVEVEMHDVAA